MPACGFKQATRRASFSVLSCAGMFGGLMCVSKGAGIILEGCSVAEGCLLDPWVPKASAQGFAGLETSCGG